MMIYDGLALLFQPLFKIPLGRELWNIVDVIVALGLVISIWAKPIKKNRSYLKVSLLFTDSRKE